MKTPLVVATITMIFCLGACRKEVAWTESHTIPKEWDAQESVEFNLDPSAYEAAPANRFAELTARAVGDTVARLRGKFHAVVSLRYTRHCNAREAGIIAERVALDAPIVSDTLTFRLFDEEGTKPLGRGRFGIYELQMQLPGVFTASEGTMLSLTPVESDHPIRGITDATLILYPCSTL